MTDMIHHYLKAAWEEVAAKERKWMASPELVPSKPDVNGMLNDIQKQRAKHPIPASSPIASAAKRSQKTKKPDKFANKKKRQKVPAA